MGAVLPFKKESHPLEKQRSAYIVDLVYILQDGGEMAWSGTILDVEGEDEALDEARRIAGVTTRPMGKGRAMATGTEFGDAFKTGGHEFVIPLAEVLGTNVYARGSNDPIDPNLPDFAIAARIINDTADSLQSIQRSAAKATEASDRTSAANEAIARGRIRHKK
jgi:hypothetical protein